MQLPPQHKVLACDQFHLTLLQVIAIKLYSTKTALIGISSIYSVAFCGWIEIYRVGSLCKSWVKF